MSGYDKLTIVDRFEEQHDNQAAVRRACDVMLEYLTSLKRPLPDIATRALKISQEYCAGHTGVDSLHFTDQEISLFLKRARQSGNDAKDIVSIVQASGALIQLLREPAWGGGASEALSYFLEYVDDFELNHSLFESILERKFSETKSTK